jgi:glucose-6-phosphate 1-dehydrogenase
MATTAAPPLSDTLVMFGASGDLAKKKLFPAVYRLTRRGLLDAPVIGVALDHWTDEDLRAHARAAIVDGPDEEFDQATFDKLSANLAYVRGDYNDDSLYPEIASKIAGAKQPLFHLAIPPSLFATVANGLAKAKINKHARLIIEKPFGRDLASARALNADLHKHFAEDQIFRIDHFLGKEALRSLLVSRFANTLLEPVWNRNYVSSVKITMAEAFGVEDRGHFYDGVGALKDVLQNHLLQMTSLIAMDQPVDESAEALRDEKVRVLRAVRTLTPDAMVRGQYDGYLDVKGVAADSDTETYVALRLDIHSPRWADVPFFIRTGKALEKTVTEWTVEFRVPPRPLFVDDVNHPPPNQIAPEHLELSVAEPEKLAENVRHAGAIFLGRYTPEALGDYCAGPNHVLPTSGTARFSSPLGVYDFQKRTSIIQCSQQGAATLAKIASTLARSESLEAHALSAEFRSRK